MATFSIYIVGTGTTTAYLSGTFTGGDPAYQNVRCVEVFLRASGGSGRYVDVFSEESSGGDNHFYQTITGLLPDTVYTWSAVLQYYDAAGWHDTSYTDSGSFRTDAPPPPETFSASLTQASGSSNCDLNAEFRNGDPAYQGNRRVELVVYLNGAVVATEYYLSRETSGADGTFSGVLTGLRRGTTYTWEISLQYHDAAGWHYTTHDATGTITISPGTYVQVWINNGGWKKAVPWVYNDGWKRAEPWICNGSWKGST